MHYGDRVVDRALRPVNQGYQPVNTGVGLFWIALWRFSSTVRCSSGDTDAHNGRSTTGSRVESQFRFAGVVLIWAAADLSPPLSSLRG